MKKLSIIIVLFCIVFQGCDSGSKKNEDEVSLPEIKKSSTSTIANVKKAKIISETETVFETANRMKNIPDVSETETISDSTDQFETTTDSASWKNEMSKKLSPIPLTAPLSQTVSSSGRKEKISAKTVNKKELMKAKKYGKSANVTKKLDLSKESNFGKIQKVELEKID